MDGPADISQQHDPSMKNKQHDLKALTAVPNAVILSAMLLLTLPDDPRCVDIVFIFLWTAVWGVIALLQWLKILGQSSMIIWQMMHAVLFKDEGIESPPPVVDSPTRIISEPSPPDEAPPHYEIVETMMGGPSCPDIRGMELPPHHGFSC